MLLLNDRFRNKGPFHAQFYQLIDSVVETSGKLDTEIGKMRESLVIVSVLVFFPAILVYI